MKDYKLKFILSMLAGVVFSFVFIVLAFILPVHKKEQLHTVPKGMLEKISRQLNK